MGIMSLGKGKLVYYSRIEILSDGKSLIKQVYIILVHFYLKIKLSFFLSGVNLFGQMLLHLFILR